jgi:serine/threonine protein kinase
MPYMAPEIWHGKDHTKESDIYSFGIIINEIISGNKPYFDKPHDQYLAIDICLGSRPSIRPGNAKNFEGINSENRPNTSQIYTMLQDFIFTKNMDGSYNFRKHIELSYNKKNNNFINTQERTSQESKFLNLSNLPKPINSKSLIVIIKSGRFIYYLFFEVKTYY